jgi:hypothetical protein
MADDPIAVELDPIRERGYSRDQNGAAAFRQSDDAARDVPRLLAALDAPLKLHSREPWYLAASDCEHPEPPEDTDDWHDWTDAHVPGTSGMTVCLLTQLDAYCPECTRLAYGDSEPEGDDFVSAPCDTRSAILAALTPDHPETASQEKDSTDAG